MSEKNLNKELSEQNLEGVAGGAMGALRVTLVCPRCGLMFREPVAVCPKCGITIAAEEETTTTKAKARAL